MKNPMSNTCGTAILVPGQYRGCWKIGKHKGSYTALVQQKPVSVYRDNNRDDIYDMEPETIKKGVYGINIHKASDTMKSKFIDKWSAGCQVFQSKENFLSFMDLCKKQERLYGNSFTYTSYFFSSRSSKNYRSKNYNRPGSKY